MDKVARDTMDWLIKRAVQQQLDQLEAQANSLIAAGYSVEDLERVQWPDGHSEVRPREGAAPRNPQGEHP